MNAIEALGALSSIATTIAAIAAVVSLRLMARDSWDRSKPYVYAQPVPGLWGGGQQISA